MIRQHCQISAHHHAGDVVTRYVFHDLAAIHQLFAKAIDHVQAQHVFAYRTGAGAG